MIATSTGCSATSLPTGAIACIVAYCISLRSALADKRGHRARRAAFQAAMPAFLPASLRCRRTPAPYRAATSPAGSYASFRYSRSIQARQRTIMPKASR